MAIKMIVIDEPQIHKEQMESFIRAYASQIDPEEIEQIYKEVLTGYEKATERQYIPLIIKKDVKNILSARMRSISQTA